MVDVEVAVTVVGIAVTVVGIAVAVEGVRVATVGVTVMLDVAGDGFIVMDTVEGVALIVVKSTILKKKK